MYATCVTAAGATVTVASGSKAVTDWCSRYVRPWWAAADVQAESLCWGPRLVAQVDPVRYAELTAVMADAPQLSSTKYARAHLLVTQGDTDGAIMAVSPEEALAYWSEPATGRLSVYGFGVEAVAINAARLAREVVRGVLLRAGWTVLHASAVAVNGQVILAVGSKGAGKSTAALATAVRHGWALLANDRVFVRPCPSGGVEVLPWPSAAAVGFGLLDALGWYDLARERLVAGESLHPTQDQRVTDALLAGDRTPQWDGKRELKAQVFPDQLPDWFGVNMATGGRAAVLLFPRIVPGAVPTVEEEDRGLADSDFMRGKTEDRYPDVFKLVRVDGGGTIEARRAVTNQLAALPHHSVVLGHDPMANADFLAQLVAG